MFTKTARFYDAIYSWKDYAREAATLRQLIRDRKPGARTLLDVACGTGKHLELLRDDFQVEGVEPDEALLAIARERLAGVPLHRASFTELDLLGKRFDVVTCLFSSIAYARTDEGLRAAVAAMARHLTRGGVLVVEPFFEPSRWEAGRVSARFVDKDDLKVARIDIAPPAADVITMTFYYLVGTPDGVDSFEEDHVVGLFRRDQYENAFREAGLSVEHDPDGLMGRGLFIGIRTS